MMTELASVEFIRLSHCMPMIVKLLVIMQLGLDGFLRKTKEGGTPPDLKDHQEHYKDESASSTFKMFTIRGKLEQSSSSCFHLETMKLMYKFII